MEKPSAWKIQPACRSVLPQPIHQCIQATCQRADTQFNFQPVCEQSLHGRRRELGQGRPIQCDDSSQATLQAGEGKFNQLGVCCEFL
jgi:hypothetical protein